MLLSNEESTEFDGSWKAREWNVQGWSGRDYRKVAGWVRSRYLTLEILGCIEYTNAPTEVAGALDLLMDSMCTRPL